MSVNYGRASRHVVRHKCRLRKATTSSGARGAKIPNRTKQICTRDSPEKKSPVNSFRTKKPVREICKFAGRFFPQKISKGKLAQQNSNYDFLTTWRHGGGVEGGVVCFLRFGFCVICYAVFVCFCVVAFVLFVILLLFVFAFWIPCYLLFCSILHFPFNVSSVSFFRFFHAPVVFCIKTI